MLEQMKIKSKLMLSIGALTLLGVAVNIFTANYLAKKIIGEQTESNLNIITNQLHDLTESSINLSIINYLRGCAEKNKDIVDYSYKKFLKGEFSKEQMMDDIKKRMSSQVIGKTGYPYIIDSKGILFAHAKPELIGTDVTKFEFVRRQIQQKNGYLEYLWKNPGELVERKKALYMTYFEPLDMIISVSAYREEFNSLLNMADLKKSVLSLKFGKTGYPYIIDEKGNLIIHPTLEGENVLNRVDESGKYYIKEIIQQKNGALTYSWKGPNDTEERLKIAIFRPIEEMKWIVVATSYEEEFSEPIVHLRNALGLAGFLILIVMLGAVYYISSKIANPIKSLSIFAGKIALGDFNFNFKSKSKDEISELASAMSLMTDNLKGIISEINKISADAQIGKLDTRADEEKFSGEFKSVISGLNQTLNSIVQPLSIAAFNMNQIGKGNIPRTIDSEFKGEFKTIIDSLNSSIDSINLLIEDTKYLYLSAIQGRLGARADIDKHNGEYRTIIAGVNSAFDRLVGMFDEMPIAISIVDNDSNILYSNKIRNSLDK
jgi:methyl-accepting chemotaxis protein